MATLLTATIASPAYQKTTLMAFLFPTISKYTHVRYASKVRGSSHDIRKLAPFNACPVLEYTG